MNYLNSSCVRGEGGHSAQGLPPLSLATARVTPPVHWKKQKRFFDFFSFLIPRSALIFHEIS
jgi:hypothetical protein